MKLLHKISHIEHDKNNIAQASRLRAECKEMTKVKIQRINGQLEITLWNMEKHIKDLGKLNGDKN